MLMFEANCGVRGQDCDKYDTEFKFKIVIVGSIAGSDSRTPKIKKNRANPLAHVM